MRYIWITTGFQGTHNWPECPIDEVKFLANEHRHIFKVRVQIEATHNDREIEFFVFKDFINDAINRLYGFGLKRLGRKSCEDICDELIEQIKRSRFGIIIEGTTTRTRDIIVEVSEDGEVGAQVDTQSQVIHPRDRVEEGRSEEYSPT